MQILYAGKYRQRFNLVTAELKQIPPGAKVLELCFGDTAIATYCRKTGLHWTGLDINPHFVQKAQQQGFDARFADLSVLEELPESDVCVMMGSLYHFHPRADLILEKMFHSAHSVIISEPIYNLSSARGIIGFIARRAANAGKRHEVFRFDEGTFMTLLKNRKYHLNYAIESIQYLGKDIIVKLKKNEKC